MASTAHLGRPLRWAAAGLALALAAPAGACSVCGCGDPLLAASDPAAIQEVLRLQLDTEYLSMDAGSDGAPGQTDRLTQWSYRLNATWRPLDALSLTATVPLVSKELHTIGAGPAAPGSSLTGLGDVELGARYALWRRVELGARRVQEVAVSAGAMLPTGDHGARDAGGALIDPHGQLGTGAFGPFAGLHYRLEQGDLTAFASVSYRLRTEATYADASRYKFGDALLWSLHGQALLGRRVALDLGVDGRYARADRAVDPDGAVTAAVPNTGGTVLAASPGVYFQAAGTLWLFLRGQVPFYQRLSGVQEVRPTVVTGLQLGLL